jgi:hypothetical protein
VLRERSFHNSQSSEQLQVQKRNGWLKVHKLEALKDSNRALQWRESRAEFKYHQRCSREDTTATGVDILGAVGAADTAKEQEEEEEVRVAQLAGCAWTFHPASCRFGSWF